MGFFSDSSFSYVNIQCIIEMRLFFYLPGFHLEKMAIVKAHQNSCHLILSHPSENNFSVDVWWKLLFLTVGFLSQGQIKAHSMSQLHPVSDHS